MTYKDLLFCEKPYFIPIVIKNRDFLIGYLKCIHFIEDVVSIAINNYHITNYALDSSRFNGIMFDGKYVNDMTPKDMMDYIETEANEIVNRKIYDHPDNIIGNNFLNIECSCGLGFYNFKEHKDIPHDDLICSNCGKYLILYTYKNDEIIYSENEKQN